MIYPGAAIFSITSGVITVSLSGSSQPVFLKADAISSLISIMSTDVSPVERIVVIFCCLVSVSVGAAITLILSPVAASAFASHSLKSGSVELIVYRLSTFESASLLPPAKTNAAARTRTRTERILLFFITFLLLLA